MPTADTLVEVVTGPTSVDAQRFWADRDGAILEQYWAATAQYHRQALVNVLHTLTGLTSVLEVGVMAGTNLKLVHDAFPWMTLCGTDINGPALDFARARLPSSTLLYRAGPLEFLRAQPDRAVDAILTCYTLAYLDRNDLVPILVEMLRVARRVIALAEPHTLGGTTVLRQDPMPEWAHDYGNVLQSYLQESPTRKGKVETLPLVMPVDHCNGLTVVRFTA